LLAIKKFSELTESELHLISDIHYNHWVQYNPKMVKKDTIDKFLNIYTKNELPFGIVLLENDVIIGFCVFKVQCLKKYPEFTPWISDVMILEPFRGKGYGRKLVGYAENVLKELGYKYVYLWTDQAPDFYKKIGFSYKQEVEKNEGGFGQLFYKNL